MLQKLYFLWGVCAAMFWDIAWVVRFGPWLFICLLPVWALGMGVVLDAAFSMATSFPAKTTRCNHFSQAIAEALKVNTALKCIHLSHIGFLDEGAQAIGHWHFCFFEQFPP